MDSASIIVTNFSVNFRQLHEKNDFAKISKYLIKSYSKIILLEIIKLIRRNFNMISKNAKIFDIYSLNVHNYFDNPKLFSDI